MPAYLLCAEGKTSDWTGVMGSGDCCWARGLDAGDDIPDRFSVVVDGVAGGAGIDPLDGTSGSGGSFFFTRDDLASSSDDSLCLRLRRVLTNDNKKTHNRQC